MKINFELVECEEKYFEFIRELRTHPDNISGFINQSIITESEQKKYMEKYKSNYFVCLCDGIPSGFVGVIDDDIRVATKPEYKNKGIAKFMINEINKRYPTALAKIKVDNIASIKLFESCGFQTEFLILKK